MKLVLLSKEEVVTSLQIKFDERTFWLTDKLIFLGEIERSNNENVNPKGVCQVLEGQFVTRVTFQINYHFSCIFTSHSIYY
ncbi:MAG: hypothetical protein AYK19_20645 [Theionarchaea archaeon DG-70-1]|nr:MAG: hypothetical protein AYK19_20645 [Theionarchaea archaeon DG-70-1]